MLPDKDKKSIAEFLVPIYFKTNSYQLNKSKMQILEFSYCVISTGEKVDIVEKRTYSFSDKVGIISDDYEIVPSLLDAIRQFNDRIVKSYPNSYVVVEHPWHIERWYSKFVDSLNLTEFASTEQRELDSLQDITIFHEYFDIRKEFIQFSNSPNKMSFLQICETLGFEPRVLLSGMDYCEQIFRIINALIQREYVFYADSAVKLPYHNSCVLKLRGLPWQVTESDLIEFFSPIFPKAIEIMLYPTGRATGEAYVAFDTVEETSKSAKEKDQQLIGKRYIEVFRSSKEEMELAVNRMNQTTITCVMRMRGLPYTATYEDIVNFFEGLDLVQDGIHFEYEGNLKPTGSCFVLFESPKIMNEAFKRNKEKLGSRYVELFRANVDELENAKRSKDILEFHVTNFPLRMSAEGIFKIFADFTYENLVILQDPDSMSFCGEILLRFYRNVDLRLFTEIDGMVLGRKVLRVIDSSKGLYLEVLDHLPAATSISSDFVNADGNGDGQFLTSSTVMSSIMNNNNMQKILSQQQQQQVMTPAMEQVIDYFKEFQVTSIEKFDDHILLSSSMGGVFQHHHHNDMIGNATNGHHACKKFVIQFNGNRENLYRAYNAKRGFGFISNHPVYVDLLTKRVWRQHVQQHQNNSKTENH